MSTTPSEEAIADRIRAVVRELNAAIADAAKLGIRTELDTWYHRTTNMTAKLFVSARISKVL